jgi:uncharacterized protein (TIGR00730 family)
VGPTLHRVHRPDPDPQREPATADEELLEAETAAIRTELTDEQRLARIAEELRTGFEALGHLGKAVSIFGSARTPRDDPRYEAARRMARRLGEEGYAIITGGGPGIMEAANRGARDAGVRSVGLNIELPFEQGGNPYQDIALNFEFFFTRKVMFVRYATAFVVLPGGFGTLDELFEALVLEQVDKIRDFPIVLVGVDFWTGLLDWGREHLLADGLVDERDLRLVRVTDDPQVVIDAVCAGRDRQEP